MRACMRDIMKYSIFNKFILLFVFLIIGFVMFSNLVVGIEPYKCTTYNETSEINMLNILNNGNYFENQLNNCKTKNKSQCVFDNGCKYVTDIKSTYNYYDDSYCSLDSCPSDLCNSTNSPDYACKVKPGMGAYSSYCLGVSQFTCNAQMNMNICEWGPSGTISYSCDLKPELYDVVVPSSIKINTVNTCLPLTYCRDVSDCLTGYDMNITSLDKNRIGSIEDILCINNYCNIGIAKVCGPTTASVKVTKATSIDSNYDSINISNCSPSGGYAWDDVFCNYSGYLDYNSKNTNYDSLSDYWESIFIQNPNSTQTSQSSGDTVSNLISPVSDIGDYLSTDISNSLLLCSPRDYTDDSVEGWIVDAVQINKPLANILDSLALASVVSYKKSICSQYDFSCPCSNDGLECTIDTCNTNTNWKCHTPKTGQPCSNNTGTCNSSGVCVPNPQCTTVNDCIGATYCQIASCNSSKQCVYTTKSSGSSCLSGLTCNSFGNCIVPQGAPEICRIRSESDGNYLECDINSDNFILDLFNIDFAARGLKNRVYLNFIYNGNSVLTLTSSLDLNYVINSNDKTKINTINISTIIPPFFNAISSKQIPDINFISFNGDLNLKQRSIGNLTLNQSNVRINDLNTILSINAISSDLVIASLTNSQISKIKSSNSDLNIFSDLNVNSSFSLSKTYLRLFSPNKILTLSGSNNIMSLSKLFVDNLTLENKPLTLDSSSVGELNKQVTLNANNTNAILYIKDVSSPYRNINYKIKSSGSKTAVIDINNIGSGDYNFYFSPFDTNTSASFYVKLRNAKPSSGNVNLFFDYNKSNQLDLPSKLNFKNLLDVDLSQNINILGPVFDDANYRGSNDSLFKIGSDVNNLVISDFKYYARNNISGYGVPINSASRLVLNNCVINNARSVVLLSYPTTPLVSKIYNNSFSNNSTVISTSSDNNVFFMNNFLATNTYLTSTKARLVLNGNDTNNSFGPSSVCNIILTDAQISSTYLSKPYKTIPIFYYDATGLKNQTYTPICYGGNLYYEKVKGLGCISNCFEDGVDLDGVAEITPNTALTSKYIGFDFAPLAGGFVTDWNIPIGGPAFDNYYNIIDPIISSECTGATKKLYRDLYDSKTGNKISDFNKYFGNPNLDYKYIPYTYLLRYQCRNNGAIAFTKEFNINVQNPTITFYQNTFNLGTINSQHTILDKNGSWGSNLTIPVVSQIIPKQIDGISNDIYMLIDGNKYNVGLWPYKSIAVNSGSGNYFLGPFYIFANSTDTVPKYIINSLPVVVVSDLDLKVNGLNSIYPYDVNLNLDLSLINNTSHLSRITSLILEIYSGSKKVYDYNYGSLYLQANETLTKNFELPILSLNGENDGSYNIIVKDTYYGLTYSGTFDVKEDIAAKIKTVKTPDNSIYVILLLVATTIGFVLYRNRN